MMERNILCNGAVSG